MATEQDAYAPQSDTSQGRVFTVTGQDWDSITEGISEECETKGVCTRAERARNESYLYWLAWVGQNTVSLFSTADALGPIRRAYLLNLNCDIFSSEAQDVGMPAAEAEGLADLFGGIGACAQP